MAKKLYVGNLSYSTTDASLKDAFAQFGMVSEANVIMDRMTGRSKGFGFVKFENDAEADAAIAGMNGKDVEGRQLTVNEARPMEPRTDRAPRGGNSGGYGAGDRGGRNW